jgi:hypothetical protein
MRVSAVSSGSKFDAFARSAASALARLSSVVGFGEAGAMVCATVTALADVGEVGRVSAYVRAPAKTTMIADNIAMSGTVCRFDDSIK